MSFVLTIIDHLQIGFLLILKVVFWKHQLPIDETKMRCRTDKLNIQLTLLLFDPKMLYVNGSECYEH